jgi:methyltransferase (TIGR00027 family)
MRRAVHQVLDRPPVLDDPMAVPLLGPDFAFDPERERHPAVKTFRAFMAARSRWTEDKLAAAVADGVRQYVVLGAGLDTFALRSPYAGLRVFEVDFPATQQWKRGLLRERAISEPDHLTFAPLDFEHKTLSAGLAQAGFDASAAAFFGWLGVVPYLSREAFRATLAAIAGLPAKTAVAFDYGVPPEMLEPQRRRFFETLAARVAAAGEPFKLFFSPEELDLELRSAGFERVEQAGSEELNGLYFKGRADGLALQAPGLGRMALAQVGMRARLQWA